MKMFRRLAAFAVVLSMVLAMLPATVSAGALPEDVKGTKYEDAASLLCALDIMVGDGTKFNADNNVTRAEFAKILVTAMGHLDTASAFTAKGVFDDVATSEWYAPFVEFAAQLGAINGYGDGNFGPNDNVTGYQAIKMICFASGHNACIEDPIGGYPQEYFNVAKEYNFLKNLSEVNFSVPMTRGQVAILTANVLKADMLKFVASSSEEGSSYEIMKGVNLLSQKHNVYMFEGIVTANEKTGLFGPSTILPGEVQIEKGADVAVYKAGECGIENEIGTYVKAYYKIDEDEGTETVLSYDATSSKNTKVKLAYDYIDIDDSSDSVIRYWKDGDLDAKTTKMNISADVSIIWNGAASDYDSVIEALEDAEGMQAEAEFLDYDGDDKMDIVSIKAYDTYVVGRIDADNYIITDEVGNWSTGSKKTKNLTLDMEDEEIFISITDVDGEEYAFEDIAEGDVLSVAKSQDGKVIDVKLSMDTIEGTIESIGRIDGEWVFAIDDEDYTLASTYFDYIATGNDEATVADMKVKIGKSYEFKLDVFGQLAYSDTVAGDAKGDFGFITFYALAENADANLNVRLFSAGSVDVYGVADTVTIDGEKYKGAEIVEAMDTIVSAYVPASDITGKSGYYGNGEWYGVPVLFELNDDEKIKYIDTPNMGEDEDKYTLQPVRTQNDGKIVSSSYSSSAFGSSRPVSSSLNVIQLPSNSADINLAEEYSTSKSFSSDSKYYVQLFSTDPETYTSSYAVIARGANGSKASATFTTDYYTNNTGLNDPSTVNGSSGDGAGVKTTPLFVVSGVMRAIAGEDEEETIIITGLEAGTEVSYTVDPKYYATGYILDTLEANLATGGELSAKRTDKSPVMEGDVLRLARNKDTKLVTHIVPVFYIEEKSYASAINNGHLTQTGTNFCAIDVATVMEMDGTQGVMSYLMKNTSSSFNKFPLIMDGNRIATNGDVTMTAEGYTGAFTKMMNVGGFSKITLYDADKSAGDRVTKGTINDIVTLEDATNKTNPSILIYHYRTGTNYSMVIINL